MYDYQLYSKCIVLKEEENFWSIFRNPGAGATVQWYSGSGPHSLVSEQGDVPASIMLSQEYSDTYSFGIKVGRCSCKYSVVLEIL